MKTTIHEDYGMKKSQDSYMKLHRRSGFEKLNND